MAPSADAAGTRGPGGGRFRGTPPPALQTSLAQGTPLAFGNRTPNPEIQTSIAQGTFFGFMNRTPPPEIQTSIAEGTPPAAFRGRTGFGGGRALDAAATVLGIDATQLRTELQADGASLEKIAAARGIDRATFRQRLIDAVRGALNQAVTDGTLTQDAADQQASDFESNVDSTLDRVGGGGLAATPTP